MSVDTSSINVPELDERNIYEGGTLNGINSSDLLNNDVAIKQLINNYNLKLREAQKLQNELVEAKSDLSYIKTSPYVAGFSMLVDVIGTIIVGYGVNLLSEKETTGNDNSAYVLLICGGLLVLFSGLCCVFYNNAKSWFNK